MVKKININSTPYDYALELYKETGCSLTNESLDEAFERQEFSLFKKFIPLVGPEKFYRDCFMHSKNGIEDFRSFISSADMSKYGIDKSVWIPTVSPDKEGCLIEKDYFCEKNNNVQLCPHWRYDVPYYHTHEFFEFSYVLAGSCCHEINGEAICLSEGDICIIPPHIQHMICVLDDNSLVMNILLKHSSFKEVFPFVLSREGILSGFFTKSINGEATYNFLRFSLNLDIRLKKLVALFLHEYQSADPRGNIINEYIMQVFLGYLILYNDDKIITSEKYTVSESDPITPMLRYIADNFKDVTLKEVAEHFSYSPQHVSRLVHQNTNMTFIETINKHKLNTACYYLRTSNIKIQDIAEQSGFQSREHFTRMFKRTFKTSPAEYRKYYNRVGGS